MCREFLEENPSAYGICKLRWMASVSLLPQKLASGHVGLCDDLVNYCGSNEKKISCMIAINHPSISIICLTVQNQPKKKME
jgi:hypothetical protein